MNSQQPPSRLLTTSARVHPSYLPYLHNASRGAKGAKWVPPLVALVGVGYGVASYRETQITRHLSSTSTSVPAATTSAMMDATDVEKRRLKKANALADAYGDRSSLEELEHAMRVYEAQQGNE
ncbi:hypothetical protein B0T17DRAFT_482283 [Bombardia bombarda]|uniref:Uncharacterized protein n=1 Tax=Bombardia bombarda TaxID=252184 RepID=A0AA39XNS6_9PEZI|nr:hypothetical protein B0T17DRAFT_482283 [Bombardia bombarda]